MQNGFIERFNKTLRTEILDMYLFRTLSEVRVLTEDWRAEYNEERPYSSLGDMPPLSMRGKNCDITNIGVY